MSKAKELIEELDEMEVSEDSRDDLKNLLKKAKTFTAGRIVPNMERNNDLGVVATIDAGMSMQDARKEAVEISKKSKYSLITNRPTKESDIDGGANPAAKEKIKSGKMITLVYLERP